MINEEQMIYCLIAFIIGYLISRQMGNGFSIGAQDDACNLCSFAEDSNTRLQQIQTITEAIQTDLIQSRDSILDQMKQKDSETFKQLGALTRSISELKDTVNQRCPAPSQV